MGTVTLFGLNASGIVFVSSIERFLNPAFKNPRENSNGVFADLTVKAYNGMPYIFLVTGAGEICVYSYQL